MKQRWLEMAFCSCLLDNHSEKGADDVNDAPKRAESLEASQLLLLDAERKLKEGDHPSCIRLLQKSIKIDGANAEAEYLLGHVLYVVQGKPDDAEGHLLKALALDCNHQKTLSTLGFLACEKKQFDESASYLERATELNDQDAAAWSFLGVAYKASGKQQNAVDAYLKAVQLNPKDVTAFYNLANLYHDLGDNENSIQNFNKVIEIDPRHADAWYNMGVVHHESQNLEKAMGCYEKAAEINPEFNEAREHGMTLRTYLERKEQPKKSKRFLGKTKTSK
eukprot:CAMPEP_0194717604 /NCGR_PEP_ID=MMETSP0296-20130528/9241_1 /TAXON_ID=39354 /ORGANISM="Heterosigma akashiwo, Strain CCMP2393" /LENGTH=277 /DNA_ID=CAMNT_0039618547 /DNA_START=54 /DNA_END=887 /DNA_ORIENTATION=-